MYMPNFSIPDYFYKPEQKQEMCTQMAELGEKLPTPYMPKYEYTREDLHHSKATFENTIEKKNQRICISQNQDEVGLVILTTILVIFDPLNVRLSASTNSPRLNKPAISLT